MELPGPAMAVPPPLRPAAVCRPRGRRGRCKEATTAAALAAALTAKAALPRAKGTALWATTTTAPTATATRRSAATARGGGGADVRAAAGEAAPQTLPLLEKRVISGEKVLQISKADFTVSSVLDKIKRGKLDLRPSYQRDFVWDKKTASKLIESLLLNIPVPTMFFHEREKGILEVVDGKQRLTSIWSYIVEARFPDGTDFSLTGLEVLHKLNGLKYCDLDESSKEAMQDFALNVHTISRHSDDDVVFEVFERLNMGSTQLNEQELRNCIFQGSYNDLLEELVKNTHMQQALRLDAPHKRMRDRELILRFFALRRGGIEGFFTPNKAWLNAEIRRHQFLDSEEARAMTADFAYCIRTAVEVFGKRAFRRPQAKDGADGIFDDNLWDVVMVTAAARQAPLTPPFRSLAHSCSLFLLQLGFLSYRNFVHVYARREMLQAAMDGLLAKAEFRDTLRANPKSLAARWRQWNTALAKSLGPP
eukprot:SM000015S01279  [mRNA]  locus=s15:1019066:1023271:+ [translate_table: standard]